MDEQNLPDVVTRMKPILDIETSLQGQRFTDAIKEVSRISDTAAQAFRAFENSGIRQALEAVNNFSAFRQFEALRLNALDTSSIMRTMEMAREAAAHFDAVRFRLPEIGETARLIADLRSSVVSDSLRQYAEQASRLQRAIEGMRTPWLDAQESLRSITAFAELQSIGNALRHLPTFDESFSATLRLDLGDWRDGIRWPAEIFQDVVARSEFYATLGFDAALTDFPRPAFEQSIDIAGLRYEKPSLVTMYGRPVIQAESNDEEEALERTNAAHDWLLRLETQLRAFIDKLMTSAFGADWPKRHLPNGLYEQWHEKQVKAKQADGADWPLIAYADFTDYERVICKSDNWRQVFTVFFTRPESIRESFQRLYPIRLDTMHARPITQDDELLLFVETRRLIKVIQARSK